MSKKMKVLFGLLIVFSMILSACAPAAGPAVEMTEEPVVEVPTTEAVIAAEASALDAAALLPDFWASIPADKGYGSVSAAKLNEELADHPVFLLDVRETSELEKDGYIEGTVNIPVRSLLSNLDKLPDMDQPIVVYCGSGHRGGYTVMTLKMLGYTDVRNLNGGVGAWKKANMPLVTGSLPATPAVISSPIVENEALFTTLDGFFVTMPDDFYSVRSDVLATELAEKTPFLIDVRSQVEWDKDGYIEGATHIPFSDFLTSLDQLYGCCESERRTQRLESRQHARGRLCRLGDRDG